jgi:hypothetical protein
MRILFIAILLVPFAGSVQAATSPLTTTKITEVLTDQTNYGECMARLEINPATFANVRCKNYWVSFGCTGDFIPKQTASNMFTVAQLALVADLSVKPKITDDEVFNGPSPGYCTVRRIDAGY